MAEPDLSILAARAGAISADVKAFAGEIRAAREAALGSEDGSDPGCDDGFESYDAILTNLDGAHLPFDEVVEGLAAIEGYRAFRRAGVVR
jgi:hypothetical protein